MSATASTGTAKPRGLFLGLATADLIQRVRALPAPDQKISSQQDLLRAGGPAANAAVAFAGAHRLLDAQMALSGAGRPLLLTRLGRDAIADLVTADLTMHGVDVHQLAGSADTRTPIASVLVTEETGERAVISPARPVSSPVSPPVSSPGPSPVASPVSTPGSHPAHTLSPTTIANLLDGVEILEWDGWLPELAEPLLRAARDRRILTILDGGSVKPWTAELLPLVDLAVVSSAFRPVGCDTPASTLDFLAAHGVRWAAITQGAHPILLRGADGTVREVPVPPASPVVSTLGAGDAFHGALARVLAGRRATDLDDITLIHALEAASRVTAAVIAHADPRGWLADDAHDV